MYLARLWSIEMLVFASAEVHLTQSHFEWLLQHVSYKHTNHYKLTLSSFSLSLSLEL